MMEALGGAAGLVGKIRQRGVEAGVDAAMEDRRRPGARPKPKLNEKPCAQVMAVACLPAPQGAEHWTLGWLADQVVQLGFVDAFSHEAVRQRLKKHAEAVATAEMVPSRGRRGLRRLEGRCSGSLAPAYPVVCFDESPKQLLGEVRMPSPAAPGAPARDEVE